MCRTADTLPKAACLSRVEQSFSKSIGDGLLGNVCSMRCRENIHDRAFYRGDRHSLMLADLLRCEVGSMNHDPFGVLAPQPCRHRNSEVNTRWVHVRDAVEQQGRFMRQGDALRSLTCLCPQDSFAVLGKPVCRKVCDPVDASAHSLQPATLRKPYQHRVLNPLGTCVFGREQAIMLFGKCIQLVHASTWHEYSMQPQCRNVNIIPLWNYIEI